MFSLNALIQTDHLISLAEPVASSQMSSPWSIDLGVARATRTGRDKTLVDRIYPEVDDKDMEIRTPEDCERFVRRLKKEGGL